MSEAEKSASELAATRFTRLLNAHQAALVSFAYGMVGERELARDIVQEALVAAWRLTAREQPPFDEARAAEEPRRWLFAVTYRQAALALRHRRHFTWQSLDGGGADDLLPATPDFASAVAETDAVQAALHTIGPVDAACVLLQVVQGFSTSEIAVILRLRPGAVRKRLSRARHRLRAAYKASPLGDIDAVAGKSEASR